MAVILNVEHLRKHFGPDPVLSDVTFQVRSGDKIGLVGPNGCGKTTLLNILVGREETERGAIEKSSDITLGYLEQRPEVVPGRTVREEAQLALAHLVGLQKEAEEIAVKIGEISDSSERDRLARRYDHIHEELVRHDAYNLEYRVEMVLHGVGFLDEDFTKMVEMLSGGELNRLSLAKLLLTDPDIMLLDEPSNHLDMAATEWLEEYLAKTSAAVILVSHDRYFLDRVTTRTFELYMGTIDDYPGNFSKYTLLKEERLLVQTRTYEKYVEEVEKTKDFIRRHHYGMKAAQAEDRRKKLQRLEEEPAELPRKITTPGMSFPQASRTGDIVFRVDALSRGFDGRTLFSNLTLDIQRGERWAILGPNGCGKTTFLRCLMNGPGTPNESQVDETDITGSSESENSFTSGSVRYGEGVKVGYFDQQLLILDSEQPVMEAIRPKGIVFEDLERRKLLGAFGLTGDQQLQTVGSLSGGQRCRAALAKLAALSPSVMILDEPTNHLDLWARAALETAIKNFDGTVLFVSHDRYFVDQVADHLLIIQPDARFYVLEGNYTTFRHMVAKGLIVDPFVPHALDSTPPGKTASRPATGSSGPKKSNTPVSASTKSAKPVKPAKPAKPMGKGTPSGSGSNPSRPAPVPIPPGSKPGPGTKVKVQATGGSSGGGSGSGGGYGTRSRETWQRNNSEAAFKEEQGRSGSSAKSNKDKKKRKYPYRKTTEIEEEIFVRETQVMTLQEELLQPEILRNGDKVKELQSQIKEEEDALAKLYEHWEEASELNW